MLCDEHGNWVTAHDDMCTLVRNYFNSIFTEKQGDQQAIISCVQPRVSEEDNNILTQPFTEQEFKDAVFSMHPDKSPGPDGLNPAFFHRFWNDIRGDIFTTATSWLANGVFPLDLNATHIVLAPKWDNPESIISLCNVL